MYNVIIWVCLLLVAEVEACRRVGFRRSVRQEAKFLCLEAVVEAVKHSFREHKMRSKEA